MSENRNVDGRKEGGKIRKELELLRL